MEIDIIKKSIVENIGQISLIIIILLTMLGIFLGVTKRVVFYADYNDLGLSLSIFAVPLVSLIILKYVAVFNFKILIIPLLLAAGLICILIYNTWKSNNKKILPVLIIMPSKLILSFLYIIYLYSAFTEKGRRARGQSFFVITVLTPLLLALVQAERGRFNLTRFRRTGF